jgi:hypothetical protein
MTVVIGAGVASLFRLDWGHLRRSKSGGSGGGKRQAEVEQVSVSTLFVNQLHVTAI